MNNSASFKKAKKKFTLCLFFKGILGWLANSQTPAWESFIEPVSVAIILLKLI